MEIYVSGQIIDINDGQDVSMSSENIRFADAVADTWSTDIELPLTDRNIVIFGAFGLLDRGGPIYERRIDCQVLIEDHSYDGYLQVTSIKDNTMTVTAFLLAIPSKILDKELKDYYPEDDYTSIYRWDRRTPIQTGNFANIGFWEYSYNDENRANSRLLAQIHPCVKAQYINELIDAAEDITLPGLNPDLRVMATKKVLTPQVTTQVLSSYCHGLAVDVGGKDIPFVGGQHITNDVKCDWSYEDIYWNSGHTDMNYNATFRNWVNNGHRNVIKFNRSGKMNIKVYAVCDRSDTIVVRLYKNGVDVTTQYVTITTPVHRLTSQPSSIDSYLSFAGYNVTYAKDDEFSVRYHYVSSGAIAGDEVYATIYMEHSGYEITEDDYGEDLGYIAMPFGFGYAWYQSSSDKGEGWLMMNGDGKGPALLNYSYCYYGVWANMPSCKLRDWITGMCWVHDRKVEMSGYDLSFVSAHNAVTVDGTIIETIPMTDKLGKLNMVMYRDDNWPIVFKFADYEFADDDVTVYTTPFGTAKNKYGKAILYQYKFEDEFNETQTAGEEATLKDVKVDFEDLGLMLFALEQSGRTYVLTRAPQLTTFGLDELKSLEEVKIETYTHSTRDADYVYLDGHKYLVISGETDTETGLTTLDTILMATKFGGTCAAPTFIITVYPSVTDAIAQYTLTDNTEAGTFAMTVNGQTYTLDYGTHWETLSGLTADTQYTISVSGSNSCGSLSETYTFRTYASMPPTVTISDIYNIDRNGAIVSFTIT